FDGNYRNSISGSIENISDHFWAISRLLGENKTRIHIMFRRFLSDQGPDSAEPGRIGTNCRAGSNWNKLQSRLEKGFVKSFEKKNVEIPDRHSAVTSKNDPFLHPD
ncbi:MAG: hypothetical protein AAGJ80_00360, partial [Cyanobacteria bacterium J06553_1]